MPSAPEHQQHEGDIRIRNGRNDLLAERFLVNFDGGARGVQALPVAVEADDLAAIQLARRSRSFACDDVNQVVVEGLLFR